MSELRAKRMSIAESLIRLHTRFGQDFQFTPALFGANPALKDILDNFEQHAPVLDHCFRIVGMRLLKKEDGFYSFEEVDWRDELEKTAIDESE